MATRDEQSPGDLDIDIELLDLSQSPEPEPDDDDEDAAVASPLVGIGPGAGRPQDSFLRRDEETEEQLKEKARAKAKAALEKGDDEPVIIPKAAKGDGEQRESYTFDEFKRSGSHHKVATDAKSGDNNGSNAILLFGFGAMALVALMIFVLAKLM